MGTQARSASLQKEEPGVSAHNQPSEELLQKLKTNPETGLTSAQVAELKAVHGENRLREKKKKTTLQRFIDQFKDVMILILIAAAIVSFVVVIVAVSLFLPAVPWIPQRFFSLFL